MKNVLLMTLKFMIEQLQFFVEVGGGKANNLSLDTPMGMMWPVVEALYDIAEKLRKKDSLKDNALQLQIVIMKVSPNEFLKEKSYLLVQTQKVVHPYFESKKTYELGMQIMLEISSPRASPFNKYQDWSPEVMARRYLLLENGTKDVLMPIKEYKKYQKHQLMRKMQQIFNTIPIPFTESFILIFNPKVIPDNLSPLTMNYLKQMAFEDLSFTCETAIIKLFSLQS